MKKLSPDIFVRINHESTLPKSIQDVYKKFLEENNAQTLFEAIGFNTYGQLSTVKLSELGKMLKFYNPLTIKTSDFIDAMRLALYPNTQGIKWLALDERKGRSINRRTYYYGIHPLDGLFMCDSKTGVIQSFDGSAKEFVDIFEEAVRQKYIINKKESKRRNKKRRRRVIV